MGNKRHWKLEEEDHQSCLNFSPLPCSGFFQVLHRSSSMFLSESRISKVYSFRGKALSDSFLPLSNLQPVLLCLHLRLERWARRLMSMTDVLSHPFFKGMVQQKWKILPSFTHFHIISNLLQSLLQNTKEDILKNVVGPHSLSLCGGKKAFFYIFFYVLQKK